jgi:DNA-binding SARP family transcriptional activator/ketosteroid isomerase-like protein
MLELRMCGGVEVEVDGRLLPESLIGGRQGRLVLAYLICERDRAVRREELAELLWPEQLPESWTASLSAVISRLRRLFTEAGLDGTSVVVSTPGAYELDLPAGSRVDLDDLVDAVDEAEAAAASGDADRALDAAARADALAARGFLTDDCEWVDSRRETIRDLWVRGLIARSVTQLGVGASGRAIEAARRAVELDASKEAAYRQLMLALAAAGERAEALRVWERCRITLVDELGIDPSPETEAVYLRLLDATPPAPVTTQLPSGVVTFLLTDIVESSVLWEEHATAMAAALERHDAIVGAVVAAHGGMLLKSKLEGDATVSVFARATEGAAAALALLDAIAAEPWAESARPRVRMAMHTGEAFERDGDYFGPALNRAARLRSLAGANEVLLSQAVAEVVRDHLPAGVLLRDRGRQNLRGLSRAENVFELTRIARTRDGDVSAAAAPDDLNRPPVPATLAGTGPFVGRENELAQLSAVWQRAAEGELGAVFVGGEPGVGKSRLAGEVAQRVHAAGGLVLYGRCDEDLAAPLQPFIEAVRVLAPVLGTGRLRGVRGVGELTRVLPELDDLIGYYPAVRADVDTERVALFDAVTQLFATASRDAPVLLVLDDLHWAGKTTLSLLRHLLRGARGSRLLVVGTYRDTELARTHPLAETLADLRRDTATHRSTLGGLGAEDVAAYLAAIGNTDRALGRELAEVTAGNPFFLIEVIRHVEESGGSWQPGTLPEGVREATGRRLSRLSDAANEALAIGAVVGATFDLALVEQVRGGELVDAIAEAVHAGLVVEEAGSFARFRFAHAIVRQVLLSELVSLKRVRLHRSIAELLEATPTALDPDARLADLAYHWYECASAGSADKAVTACRRAADRAIERLAYEEAGDLYGMALQALEWVDDADVETGAALHLAHCDARLTAGDVAGARDAIDALELAAAGSERLAAWYTTYEGLLAVLGEPDRLTEIVQSIGAAAGAMRDVGDVTGEAKARYVHAAALERLGQIGAAEKSLDSALAAARSAGDHRLADAILAEAPPAALWGPSPVTRASGRCLDVVRVLRITSGSPAVEAVALRCQAVLEALRGRMDAARRMIGSARRTVEQLGLTHRRLEAEVFAGFIELLDGEAASAEEHLRVAYDGLRVRGLGGEAALAGAFLGRALLLQDRVDDADEVAAEAEALAGADLKAAIAWRVVRALATARRRDTDRALALAREAVELASATDALLLVADARLALAGVLRIAGDVAAADAEACRAVEACEAKGATFMTALARSAISVPSPTAVPDPRPVGATSVVPPTPNLAMAASLRFVEAYNRGDWDAIGANAARTWKFDDRRPIVSMTATDGEPVLLLKTLSLSYEDGARFDPPELLVTRGDHAVLCRWVHRAPGMEVPFLGIMRVDADGRTAGFVMFEPEDVGAALDALDERGLDAAFENAASSAQQRLTAAFNSGDWDALVACIGDDCTTDDRRPVVGVPLDRAQMIATLRLMFEGGGELTIETVATRGRSLALSRSSLRVTATEPVDGVLTINAVDGVGCITRSVIFEADEVYRAIAELDRLFLRGEGAEHGDVLAVVGSFFGAIRRRDIDALAALLAPDFVVQSHRDLELPDRTAVEWLDDVRATFETFGDAQMQIQHVAHVGPRGGLWAFSVTGEDRDGGPFEIPFLVAVRVEGDRLVRIDVFDEQDVDAAVAALGHETPVNAARRTADRTTDALNRRDWRAFLDTHAPGYVFVDNRHGIRVRLDGDDALDAFRVALALDEFTHEHVVLATRGDRLALARVRVCFIDGEAGPSEVEAFSLVECRADGLIVSDTIFDPDDLGAAYAALSARHSELLAEATAVEIVPPNVASRALARYHSATGRRDFASMRECLAEDMATDDRRRTRLGGYEDLVGRDAVLGSLSVIPELRSLRFEARNVATRGDRLVLSNDSIFMVDGLGGEAVLEFMNLVEVDPSARIVLLRAFAPEDRAAAFAHLEARWLDGEGAPYASVLKTAQRIQDAFKDGDADRVQALLADDLVVVDHRTLGWGEIDKAEYMQMIGYTMPLAGINEQLTVDAIAPHGQCVTCRTFGNTDDGGEYEAVFTCVAVFGDDVITRLERFDVGDRDAAIARLHELGRPAPDRREIVPPSLASRTLARFFSAISGCDVAATRECLAEDVSTYDQRTLVSQDPLVGRDAVLDGLPIGGQLQSIRFEPRTVASRGERLVLSNISSFMVDSLGGDAVVEAMSVVEVDESGRIVWIHTFDPGDIDAAIEDLDARYAATLGGVERETFEVGARALAALNRRDYVAGRGFFAQGAHFIDHRHGRSAAATTPDEAVEQFRSFVDIATDYRIRTEAVKLRGSVGWELSRASGTDTEGGQFELRMCVVWKVEGGCYTHLEAYEEDDVDEALAQFDELSAR